jgi:hypothetical protein
MLLEEGAAEDEEGRKKKRLRGREMLCLRSKGRGGGSGRECRECRECRE